MSDHAHEVHWHAEPWPLLVGFGAGFFLPWAFMFQFVYEQGLVAIIVLALGLLMMLVGGIGWGAATIGVVKDEGWSPAAMLMFIGTEIMTILGVLAAYWTSRLQQPVWPPEGTPEISIPFVSTVVLILSSFSAAAARRKQLAGDAGGFANLILLSTVIWIVFAAMTVMNWTHLAEQGFAIGTNAYSMALFGMGGVHFAHIIFGILIMFMALPPAFKGRLSPSYARSIAMYVHFVNILGVWVMLQVYVW